MWMLASYRLGWWPLALLALTAPPGLVQADEIPRFHGPILTWNTDPTSTITVTWIERVHGGDAKPEFTETAAWISPADGAKWRRVSGSPRPFADTGNRVHSVHFENLEADRLYEVTVGAEPPTAGIARLRFRTAPGKLDKPLLFVTGGDMATGPMAQAMNRQAGQSDPLFAMIGGDVAYANGKVASLWYRWIDNWKQFAVTPDGRTLPLVMGIGNHEIGSDLSQEEADKYDTHPRSKFFFSLFRFPEKHKAHYVLDFGDYLSLFLLDSDHAQPVKDQTAWLSQALAERADRPYRFICYHKPTYGTAKSPNMNVRREWCPLFEQHRVTAVFENDHHTFKRTFPIRDGQIDHEHGILYLGDGAWGVNVRKVPDLSLREKDPAIRVDPATKQELWHLAKAKSINHLWRVTVSPGGARYEAVDKDGTTIDRWPAD